MGYSKPNTVRYVVRKCGVPFDPVLHRPSVEYTGKGNTLMFDGWGGRFFRSSEESVRKECDEFIKRYTGNGNGDEGEYLSYNDLYRMWGIISIDHGALYGYSPSADYFQNITFVYTWYDKPGQDLYELFKEPVLCIEPDIDSFPQEYYMEV